MHGIGEALVFAACLAFTIDRWFKQDSAKDVFEAALGQVLLPEFRDEMRWLTSFEWLATESDSRIKLEDMRDGTVRVSIITDRKMQNISAHKKKYRGYAGSDDWGLGSRATIKCSIYVNGEMHEAGEREDRPDHVSCRTIEVEVKPDEFVIYRSEGLIYQRADDHFVLAFTHPTRSPSVSVEASGTLAYQLGLSDRGS